MTVRCYVIDTRKIRSKDTFIKAASVSVALFIATPDVSFAAGTGIDVGAEKIYKKLVNIGKWVIIVKGGIDTIKTVADGDLPSAKKNFLGYGVTYAILWGLPWMMAEIEKLFDDMS